MTDKINIVIEGMDATGKRTVSEGLAERLNAKKSLRITLGGQAEPETKDSWYWEDPDLNYKLISFPEYENTSGVLVKEYLFSREHVPADLEGIKRDSLLYSLNRFETMSSKFPSSFIERNPKGYIFDRYTTSNILYQTMNLPPAQKLQYISWLKDLEFNLYGLPKPDKVIVLVSTSDKLIQENIESRGREQDFLETVEMQKKIRENILFMVEHEGWIPIVVNQGDEMRPRESILNDVYKAIFGG